VEAAFIRLERYHSIVRIPSLRPDRGHPGGSVGPSGERVSFRTQGPGTVIVAGGAGTTSTDSIDARVERDAIGCVDFIKLDVEGCELGALRGAESTLRRFHPRAIAAEARFAKPLPLAWSRAHAG
jgi:hypothetical protein